MRIRRPVIPLIVEEREDSLYRNLWQDKEKKKKQEQQEEKEQEDDKD